MVTADPTVARMATEEGRSVHCADCGRRIDEAAGLDLEERSPCPDCGSLNRRISVQLSEQVEVRTTVSARVIAVGEASETDSAQPVDVEIDVTDLPTEFVAEVLVGTIFLVPPDPDEVNRTWLMEVGAWDIRSELGAGELDDVLMQAASFLRDIAARWQTLRGKNGE